MEGNPGSLILCSVSISGVGEGQRDTHCLWLILTLGPGKAGCFSAAHFTAALLTHLCASSSPGDLVKMHLNLPGDTDDANPQATF